MHNRSVRERGSGTGKRSCAIDNRQDAALPKMTEAQAKTLMCFITAGDNPETGNTNYSAWWEETCRFSGVREKHRDYFVLSRRGLLFVLDEHPESREKKFELTVRGREVAMQLVADQESRCAHV